MKQEFTPGPWRTEKENFDFPAHTPISADGWYGFAQVVTTVDGESDLTGKANARLIAAAPFMLHNGWIMAMRLLQSKHYTEDGVREAVDEALALWQEMHPVGGAR